MSPKDLEKTPRFQLFIVNTGWHSDASAVVEENMENFKSLMDPIPVFVLSKEQSRKVLLSDPNRIGTDPCFLLIDQHASGGQGANGYHGFMTVAGPRHKQEGGT